MSPAQDNFYADWRRSGDFSAVLRDERRVPSERLLQAIWRHQRLCRDRLRSTDGRPVRVLHPGFASVEGGPDFQGAVIQIGDQPPQSGDIEIDLQAGGWRAHGHDRNPAFRKVLLQVVWNSPGGGVPVPDPGPGDAVFKARSMGPPVMPVSAALDAPLADLARWLENDSPRSLPEDFRGQCCAALRELDGDEQGRILDAASAVRFQARAEQFGNRARHAGWEQALWEGLFRALGYKHNVWPMQALAETLPQWRGSRESAVTVEARLFGISGLLPPECPRASEAPARHIRALWDCWWRERDEFSELMLPRSIWRFHGSRPANHPQRRMALAAHWLAEGRLLRDIEKWCAMDWPDSKLLVSLRHVLEVKTDPFWSWHWTFRSARLLAPQPLLGGARVADLAVNVILPWLWIRAREGGNKRIQRSVEHRYAAWPGAEDNALLKLARQRLLGVGRSPVLRSAAAQQGLIQILRDFCEHSNAVCAGCRFPELVRNWDRRGSAYPAG